MTLSTVLLDNLEQNDNVVTSNEIEPIQNSKSM